MAMSEGVALRIQELIDWLGSLPADFAFLLALPFFVAAVAFAGDWYERRRARRAEASTR